MSDAPAPTPAPPSGPAPYRYRGGYCACGRCRCRGLLGPVVLITLGTLFLLGEFTRLDFSDLWPVLLIVIGVMKLLEYSASIEGHRG